MKLERSGRSSPIAIYMFQITPPTWRAKLGVEDPVGAGRVGVALAIDDAILAVDALAARLVGVVLNVVAAVVTVVVVILSNKRLLSSLSSEAQSHNVTIRAVTFELLSQNREVALLARESS